MNRSKITKFKKFQMNKYLNLKENQLMKTKLIKCNKILYNN